MSTNVTSVEITCQNQSVNDNIEENTKATMSEQKNILLTKVQDDHDYETPVKVKFICNTIENKTDQSVINELEDNTVKAIVIGNTTENKTNQSVINELKNNTKSNTSQPKTFVLAKHQDINVFKIPVPNQSVVKKLEKNTILTPNTSQPKTFVLAKRRDINGFKISVQNQSVINKLDDNTISNTSQPKTFVFAKHQDINGFKIPVRNQSVINQLEDKTIPITSQPKTFVFAKRQDINAYKISMQEQSVINKLEDNTKPNTFVFAKRQDIIPYKVPLQNQPSINEMNKDNSKPNTSEPKTFVFAKHIGINGYKIPVQNQSVVNKPEYNPKPNTSLPKKFVFAKRQDINAFKVAVQNQSVINKLQNPNAYKISVQNQSVINKLNDKKGFVYCKFQDNKTFKVPVENKTLIKLAEETSIIDPTKQRQYIITRDDTVKIPVQTKSLSSTTIVNTAGKMPNKQVLINKNIIPASRVVLSDKTFTIDKKQLLNIDKVSIIKPKTSNITFSPPVINNKFNNTIIPGETRIKPTNSNSISTVNIADVNCIQQVSGLTQELKVVPSTMSKSKIYIPHNGINYMIKSIKKENPNIQSPILNSSSTVVKPILIPESVEPKKNVIVSSSNISKAVNPPKKVTQFVAKMEKLPDGKYKMLPAQGTIPVGLENLFKPTAQFVKHRTGKPNCPSGNYFVCTEDKSSSSVDTKQSVDSKETAQFKVPFQVPPKSTQPTVSNKSIDFDNISKIKKTVPLSLFNKDQINKNDPFINPNQRNTFSNQLNTLNITSNQVKTYINPKKTSTPKMCTPSGFIRLKPNLETINQLKKQQLNSANSDSQDKPTIKFSVNEQGNPQLLIKVLNPDITTGPTTSTTQGKIQVSPNIPNFSKVDNIYGQATKVSNKKISSLKKPKKSTQKKISDSSQPQTCEYEYCDTLTSGLELIDNIYCSLTCKKFDTKLKLAQEKKPIVKVKIDDPKPKKPIIDRKLLLLKLKNRINKRKQPSDPSVPKKLPRMDYNEHHKKSITIQALCENPIDKSFSKKIIKSIKGSQSDDEDILHLKPQIDHIGIKNYIDMLQLTKAPKKLFNKPFPTELNLFRVGQKLEGIDPGHETLFCVMTVVEVIGYRIKLHFDGYPNMYDFWVNADNPDIFYAKWCEENGRIVQPPKYISNFNWAKYFRKKVVLPAPKWNFTSTKCLAFCRTHQFVIGYKLEALDKLTRTSPKQLICVATVADVLGDRICIHFDGWSKDFDYWVDITSSNIHPVGWCSKNGRSLAIPSGFNDLKGKKPFAWTSYLECTNSKPVPEEAFVRRPIREFSYNMAIEVVDVVVPSLLRIAKVVDVKHNEIKICYDGFSEMYEYWVEDDSPNIHPVGWSLKTNHPLEIPAENNQRHSCGVAGCNGKGNINFLKSSHDDVKSCPYVFDNWKNAITGFSFLPDRIKSEPSNKKKKYLPKILKEFVKEYPKKNSMEIPKIPPTELSKKLPIGIPIESKGDSIKQEILKKKIAMKKAKKIMHEVKKKKYINYIEAREMLGIKPSKTNCLWKKTSITRIASIMDDMETRVNDHWAYLNNDDNITKPNRTKITVRRNAILGIPNVNASDVQKWCVQEVADFVDQIVINNSTFRHPEKVLVSGPFIDKGIDGENFLTLTLDNLTNLLDIPLGLALKISSAITILSNRIPIILPDCEPDSLEF